MSTTECDFCNEFSGNSENTFGRIYDGRPESRVIFQTPQMVVVPSLGQIVEGYLLLVPRSHFKAIGDLPKAFLDEFACISARVGEVLERAYGPYILFEHGTRSENAGGCGIYHAHLHVAPIASIPDPVSTLKAKFPYQEFDDLREIGDRGTGLPSYLLYKDRTGRLYLFDTGPLSSQYMRKLLADALNNKGWDWRTAGREERLLATLERLAAQFDPLVQAP
ncbi:MAG TPA: HIT family protein [Candidatus Aquilonibacter sp.]|nr:HIT family protein [Candidatus Aquilonibacter sp.]